MHNYALLAEALRYPHPDQLERLESGMVELENKSQMKSFKVFVKKMKRLSLAQREELHTRTLDLNPLAAPYVGYQVWGENYQRGAFMSRLNQEMVKKGIDKEGELPDHLIPILRYMTTTSEPIQELDDVLPRALKAMRTKLKKAEADNPYLHLLEAVENTFSMN